MAMPGTAFETLLTTPLAASDLSGRLKVTVRRRSSSRIHLWAGSLLGAQVLLWMASGAVMSWFQIDLVRGETHSVSITPPPELESAKLCNAWRRHCANRKARRRWSCAPFSGRPVYEVETHRRPGAIVRRATGEKMSPIDEETLRAKSPASDFVGDGGYRQIVALIDGSAARISRQRRPSGGLIS